MECFNLLTPNLYVLSLHRYHNVLITVAKPCTFHVSTDICRFKCVILLNANCLIHYTFLFSPFFVFSIYLILLCHYIFPGNLNILYSSYLTTSLLNLSKFICNWGLSATWKTQKFYNIM